MDQAVDTTKARKKRGEGASRRGEILDAAKHLFAQEGVAHVTMRKIGAAVGVSPTALYMHFADKDTLLAAIAQDTFAELVERLEKSRTEALTPLAGFRAGLRAYITFGLDRPDEYRLTFMTRLFRRDNPNTCAVGMADRSFAILQEGLTELMACGCFRPRPPELLAETIWAMVHGTTALLLDQAENLQAGADALIESMLDVLISGLLEPSLRDHGITPSSITQW